ncbi:hypothetical protein [Roseiflexus sp.]
MTKKQRWSMYLITGCLLMASACTATFDKSTPGISLQPTQISISPTISPSLKVINPSSTIDLLIENSLAYREIIQRGDQVLKVTSVPPGFAVIFFAAIGKDKGGTPIPYFSTIGVTVLQRQTTAYDKVWEKVTEVESPLAYERPVASFPWLKRYFELFDLTRDGQPEIIVGGCTGFGNRCYYQAIVWSLEGTLLFDTGSNRFGGVQFLREDQIIVTREGLNIGGQAEAELHPEQWQINRYQWNGTMFIRIATQVVPYKDYYGPALKNGE